MSGDPKPVQVGDAVRLRKAHPCGAREWRVVRVGADVGLACVGCGRKVLLTRAEFERRRVSVAAGEASAPEPD